MNRLFDTYRDKIITLKLKNIDKETTLTEEQCLFGFPHPSGSNGHGKIQEA